MPIQVQIEPPGGLGWITRPHEAGATSIGIHIESLDEEVRKHWMPGKATVSLERYDVVWSEAVRVFGRNRVSTYLLVGLGENPDQLVAGAKRLITMGVYPFVVPFRPLAASAVHDRPAPAPRRARPVARLRFSSSFARDDRDEHDGAAHTIVLVAVAAEGGAATTAASWAPGLDEATDASGPERVPGVNVAGPGRAQRAKHARRAVVSMRRAILHRLMVPMGGDAVLRPRSQVSARSLALQ